MASTGNVIIHSKEHVQNVENYEKMRSNFIDGQPKQRFLFENYNQLVINNSNSKGILKTVKKALHEKKPITGLIWASKAFEEFDGKVSQNIRKLFHKCLCFDCWSDIIYIYKYIFSGHFWSELG